MSLGWSWAFTPSTGDGFTAGLHGGGGSVGPACSEPVYEQALLCW